MLDRAADALSQCTGTPFTLDGTVQVSTHLMKLAYDLSISRALLYYKALFHDLEIVEKSRTIQQIPSCH